MQSGKCNGPSEIFGRPDERQLSLVPTPRSRAHPPTEPETRRMAHQRVSRRPMARVCLALCVLAALAVDLRVAAASAQPRPSGGAISSEEPTKTAATAATAGEEAAPVKETPPKKEEGERPTVLYVKNHHPAGILTDVHVPMPRKVSDESPNEDPRTNNTQPTRERNPTDDASKPTDESPAEADALGGDRREEGAGARVRVHLPRGAPLQNPRPNRRSPLGRPIRVVVGGRLPPHPTGRHHARQGRQDRPGEGDGDVRRRDDGEEGEGGRGGDERGEGGGERRRPKAATTPTPRSARRTRSPPRSGSAARTACSRCTRPSPRGVG